MSWICQKELPEDMRVERALPGIQPLDLANWLHIDEVYAAQMAERRRLLKALPNKVIATTKGSDAAVREALEMIVQQVLTLEGFERIDDDVLRCPDGHRVSLLGAPLHVMGELVQEDICILQKPTGSAEHILSAAVLCFPALWTLSEKIGHPMGRIHAPVQEYTEDIKRRVQRLFDGVKVGRPLWRFNRAHAGPQLFQPRLEQEYRAHEAGDTPEFLRAERQSLIRLPVSEAVIFSIHTYVIAPSGTKKA